MKQLPAACSARSDTSDYPSILWAPTRIMRDIHMPTSQCCSSCPASGTEASNPGAHMLQVGPQGTANLLLFLAVANQQASMERNRMGRLHSSLQIEFSHSIQHFPSNALQEVASEWSQPLLADHVLQPPPQRQVCGLKLRSLESRESRPAKIFGVARRA